MYDKGMFSQLNIYMSYLGSLNIEFNDLTKFETSFMLNLENSQVMFFFLLVPISSYLDFGDRVELQFRFLPREDSSLISQVLPLELLLWCDPFIIKENNNPRLILMYVAVLSSVAKFCDVQKYLLHVLRYTEQVNIGLSRDFSSGKTLTAFPCCKNTQKIRNPCFSLGLFIYLENT